MPRVEWSINVNVEDRAGAGKYDTIHAVIYVYG